MSNYPAGAEFDPRAPFNEPLISDLDELSSNVRGDLCDQLSDVVWNAVKERTSNEDAQMRIYDDIMDDVCRVWQRY